MECTLKVSVYLFALYRERAGRGHLSLDLPPDATVSHAVEEVRQLFPDLAPPEVNIVVAVNTEYADPDLELHDGDDLALIPPVSGGMSMIEITYEPLKPEEITAKVRKDTNGAVVTFLGVTRLFAEGKKVVHLEYEAYPEMALKEMEKIRRQIQSEYGVEDIAIHHRIGRVDIGEISLVVAVASPHRKEAFHACHEAVNRLKETVPIWKKEHFEEGYHWVASDNHDFAPAPSNQEHGQERRHDSGLPVAPASSDADS
jgi:molybdopterin synthase catalytic subunit